MAGIPRPNRPDLQVPQRLTRWAMWSMVLLALGAVVLGLGLVLALMNTRTGRERWLWMQRTAECQERLRALSGALDRAYEDRRALPARLEDVYPTYLADGHNLRCPLDRRNGPGTSFRYDPRATWGNGASMVVWCPMHPPPPGWAPPLRPLPLPNIPAVMGDGTVSLAPSPPDLTHSRSPDRTSAAR